GGGGGGGGGAGGQPWPLTWARTAAGRPPASPGWGRPCHGPQRWSADTAHLPGRQRHDGRRGRVAVTGGPAGGDRLPHLGLGAGGGTQQPAAVAFSTVAEYGGGARVVGQFGGHPTAEVLRNLARAVRLVADCEQPHRA